MVVTFSAKTAGRHIWDNILCISPLTKYQFAYQSGKSCEMALCEVVSRIGTMLRNKEKILSVFLEIEGTFDNTSLYP